MTITLSIDDQEKFKSDVEALKLALGETLDFTKHNLLRFNARKTENYSAYFLDILARFRLNIDGLLNLMDAFFDDYRLKVCVNLILRSICSDILTALYLYTFYDKEDPECISLKNELDLLRSEYLKSMKQSMEEEHVLLTFFDTNHKTTLEEKNEWFKNIATELLDEDGKLKTRKQIRETSSSKVKLGLSDSGSFLSELEKYKRIKDKGLGQFGFVFIAFKYYSQFQHFNHASKTLIERYPLKDTFFMAMTLENMLMTISFILQIAKTPIDEFTEELESIREKLANHFA